MRKQSPVTRLLKCALLVAFLAGVTACSEDEEELPVRATREPHLLPMAIHGMPLRVVTTGAPAEEEIRCLNGRDVAPQASYVGKYEGGGWRATLYVTRVSLPETADSLVTRMSEGIGAGGPGFGHHTRFQVDGLVIHAVLGQGQEHFFFSRGTAVTWLGIDRAMARGGLADLLDVEAHRLPAGIVLNEIDLLPPYDPLYRR